jgi:hypothetical protein
MKTPMQHAPLTTEMQAALDFLEASGDRALVRLYSQWWVRESDGKAGVRALTSGEASSEIVVVRTGTVKGLVARGLMKFTGPRVKGIQYHDRARAELIAR